MKSQKKALKTVILIWALTIGLFLGNAVSQANPQIEKAKPKTYVIDLDHSTVSFKVRHLVGNVTGRFNKFDGEIFYDPSKPEKSWVKAKIDINSIDTGLQNRDKHLLSDKTFFYAQNFPEMKFETIKLINVNGNKGQLVGKLTIRDVTKKVVLDVEMNGVTPDPVVEGAEKIGFSGSTKINRNEFGITWNKDGKDGKLMIGDEVEILLEIEARSKT